MTQLRVVRHEATVITVGFYEFIPFDRRKLHLVARVFWKEHGKMVHFYLTNGQHAMNKRSMDIPIYEAIKHGQFVPLTPVHQL